jgi:hypothetical protein
VNESRRRWDSYSPQKKTQIMAEGGENYREMVKYIGQDPACAPVQQLVARWHQNMRYFYEPTREMLLGLGQAYSQDPAFRAFFEKIHPELPDFLRLAIEAYCQRMGAPA